MKQLKKLASLLLAMVMVFGLAATALASANDPGEPGTDPVITGTPEPTSAPTTGTITINNAVAGHTYSIYRILDLTFSPATTASPANPDATPEVPAVPAAYAYTANEDWKSWLDTQTHYITFDDQGYASWVTGADAAEFAKLALAYAKTQPDIAPVATATVPEDAVNPSVIFDNLQLGYYLIDSTVGTLCMLNTTNYAININEKNEVPSNDKQVQEDSDNSWGKVNDAEIGETVDFRSAVTLPEGSESVVYHDTMSTGLTLIDWVDNATLENPNPNPISEWGIKVYSDEAMTDALTLGTDYTISIHTDYAPSVEDPNPHHPISEYVKYENNHCTFEVIFSQTYLDLPIGTGDGTRPDTVYIKYSATINASAVIGGDGNKNDSHLSYGNEGAYDTTPGSSTTTYVWSFNIFKYTGDNHPLAGAEFVLLNSDKTQVAKFKARTIAEPIIGEDGKPQTNEDETPKTKDVPYSIFVGWVNIAEITDENGVINWNPPEGADFYYKLESPVDGYIHVGGLDADTYYLREIKAPNGYNLMAEDKEVKIEPDQERDKENNGLISLTFAGYTANIVNNTGDELPTTGGIGTTIFYVVGSVLLVGAAILLITKKRMSVSK